MSVIFSQPLLLLWIVEWHSSHKLD